MISLKEKLDDNELVITTDGIRLPYIAVDTEEEVLRAFSHFIWSLLAEPAHVQRLLTHAVSKMQDKQADRPSPKMSSNLQRRTRPKFKEEEQREDGDMCLPQLL